MKHMAFNWLNPSYTDSLNKLLEDGWYVRSATPQFVSTAASYTTKEGAILLILEREK